MTGIYLRRAVKNDMPAIRHLVHRAEVNPIGLDWRRFVIAETEEGKLVGCGQLKPHADGSLELASIAVDEVYRGQGIARLIIETLLAESKRPLFLVCRPQLSGLYEKFGFCLVGSEPLPPFFKRIRWLFRLVRQVTRQEQGVIMRLD